MPARRPRLIVVLALIGTICAAPLPAAWAQTHPLIGAPGQAPTRAARATLASGLAGGGFNNPAANGAGFNAGGFNAGGGFNPAVAARMNRGDLGANCGRMLVPTANRVANSTGTSSGIPAVVSRGFTDTHRGIDLVAAHGSPVRAAATGIVSYVGTDPEYGLFVDIRHPGGLLTRYGHLSGFIQGLTPGMAVSGGMVIGSVGATGNAHGAHLHFEVRAATRPLDPAPFLAGNACPPPAPRDTELLEARAPDPFHADPRRPAPR